jgi:hypothetical protein
MLNPEIEHLSQYINPETRGIIWLTDELLDFNSPGAYEINYLLNGILTKSLADVDHEDKHSNNFFLGENFGHAFFVAHAVINDKEDIKNLDDTLSLAKPFIQEKNQVYILNRSKNTANINILKDLTKKYPDVSFSHLNI